MALALATALSWASTGALSASGGATPLSDSFLAAPAPSASGTAGSALRRTGDRERLASFSAALSRGGDLDELWWLRLRRLRRLRPADLDRSRSSRSLRRRRSSRSCSRRRSSRSRSRRRSSRRRSLRSCSRSSLSAIRFKRRCSWTSGSKEPPGQGEWCEARVVRRGEGSTCNTSAYLRRSRPRSRMHA